MPIEVEKAGAPSGISHPSQRPWHQGTAATHDEGDLAAGESTRNRPADRRCGPTDVIESNHPGHRVAFLRPDPDVEVPEVVSSHHFAKTEGTEGRWCQLRTTWRAGGVDGDTDQGEGAVHPANANHTGSARSEEDRATLLPPGEWLDVDDAQIWLTCKDDLTRYAAVLIGPSDAEDVVSTVFLRVLDRGRLGSLDDARPYLFKAVLNECKTRRTRSRSGGPSTDVLVPPPPDPQPEILEAVFSLPLGQRAATFLVYWADMSVAGAAEMMGVRPGTLKRYLHLARRKLKGVLDEHAYAE